jgi:hypothetical protein
MAGPPGERAGALPVLDTLPAINTKSGPLGQGGKCTYTLVYTFGAKNRA